MALQVSYTDKMGTTHSEAYAKITAIKIKFLVDEANLFVDLWHNSTTRSKSDADARKDSITSIVYIIKSTDFSTYLQDSVIKANETSLLSSLYGWLKQHIDGENEWTEGGRKLDNQGNGINWTTATDV